MAEIKDPQKRTLFGPFEVDLRSEELKKRGVRLRLAGQPFQILKMLLERPGDLVTREELRQALWPSDTFVDFDHGLNAAVNKLREALGEDADAPRYIETLPRRGYRFVGVIEPSVPVQIKVAIPEGRPEKSAVSANRPMVAAVGSFAVGCLIVAIFLVLRSPAAPARILSYRQLTTDRKPKGQPCEGALSARVVTDGARVFFSEIGHGLMQVSANGGEVAPVPNLVPCFAVFDISPDKTELLGASMADASKVDHPLWALSLSSGLARRIGDLNGHAAAWSPDGKRIAYATGSYWGPPNDLFIATNEGSGARHVAQMDIGSIATIVWSPDEKLLRIGLQKQSPENFMWEVSSDGSNLHPVPQPPGADCCLVGMNWTADGKYLLAQSGATLWVLREKRAILRGESSDAFQLTSGPIHYQSPTLSPDGKKIFTIGGRPRGELLRYDLQSQKLEPFLSGISAEHVDFSRDGKWVTYVTFPDSILWRSRVDGSERLQLTDDSLIAVLPRWSPDGTRIAFSGLGPNGRPKIYVVSAEGGTPELISQNVDSDQVDADATWTPDSNTLVFSGSTFDVHSKISSVNLATRHVSVIPGSEGMSSPRVSPDGRFIYAEMTHSHQAFLFSEKTQEWSKVADRTSGSAWPQWSSDSKYVYWGSDPEPRMGSFPVYRLRVADHQIEPVTTLNVPEGLIGIWGGWMSTAPDGSPLLLRDLSIQEIYALDVDLP